ncbi:MAG TPA: hypothetical protein VN260_07095 [Dissulfurispiraceae bacterium]|nr:hypothetical protein [Dissulfurispiraceae bacterium]
MFDWNVVITIHERCFSQVVRLFGKFGQIRRTEFFNVLVLRTGDVAGMLDTLRGWLVDDPRSLGCISRLIPVTKIFAFQSPEEFETKSLEAALEWLPDLAGKGFHVRMHRRGFRGKLASPDEERVLDEALLDGLIKRGMPGHITFEDPDAVLAVETVAQRAGLSLWTREDLRQYPFIRID